MAEDLAIDIALGLAEDWQRDFPLCPLPFDAVARQAGLSPADVIAHLGGLKARGILSRIGAAVRPNTIGASTLAAMSVPTERLSEVAAIVNAHRSVNHNYERDNLYNLWFVVTAADRPAVEGVLHQLAGATGYRILDLPIVRSYHIDLGFRLDGERRRGVPCDTGHPGRVELTEAEMRLVTTLEDGIPLLPRPYLALAQGLGCDEAWVQATIRRLITCGVFSRFGCILRHRAIGIASNAMTVWDVPDDDVDAVALRLAAEDAVTLCYRRVRRLPDWRYNLFAMVHGRSEAEVRSELRSITARTGLDRFASAVLFSKRCFKQDGARYFPAERGAA